MAPRDRDASDVAMTHLDLGPRAFAHLVEGNPTPFLLGEVTSAPSGKGPEARTLYANAAAAALWDRAGLTLGRTPDAVSGSRWPGLLADTIDSRSPRTVVDAPWPALPTFHLYLFPASPTSCGIFLHGPAPDRLYDRDPASFDDLTIDYRARRVTIRGRDVPLTPSEFEILARLSRSPGSAVATDDLMSARGDAGWSSDPASVEIHVSRLRRKLGESADGPRHIVTVRGVGYRFEP